MKRIMLILVSISPLVFSFLFFRTFLAGRGTYDRLLVNIHLPIGMVFFGIWFLVGGISQKFIRSKIEMLLLLNAAALLMLLFRLYQTVFLSSSLPGCQEVFCKMSLPGGFSGFIERVSYDFYFPFFRVSRDVTWRFYGHEIHGFLQYAIPFFCLLIFSFLGRVIAERRERKAIAMSGSRGAEENHSTSS